MLSRYLARRKMRWAVRRWAAWNEERRSNFRFFRMRRRIWHLRRRADDMLQNLYYDDPFAPAALTRPPK